MPKKLKPVLLTLFRICVNLLVHSSFRKELLLFALFLGENSAQTFCQIKVLKCFKMALFVKG